MNPLDIDPYLIYILGISSISDTDNDDTKYDHIVVTSQSCHHVIMWDSVGSVRGFHGMLHN